MSLTSVVRARRPADAPYDRPSRDVGVLSGYLEDASGSPAGHAAGLLRPTSETEAAAFLRATAGRGVAVLPQAARSSLTAGAVPQGVVIVSVVRLGVVGPLEAGPAGARAAAGPGVRLRELQAWLRGHGWYYPPVSTYQEAMLGGTVATNAGGAATFKYGVTRQWVRGLRVLLFNGDLLVLERGEAVVPRGGSFRVVLSDRTELAVPTPLHELPPIKKISAGYFSSDPLDLVDLFVGAEGTLGLITGVTVDIAPAPPAVVTGLAFAADFHAALALAGELRADAERARAAGDRRGPDVRAIESLDRHCLHLLREHGDAARLRLSLPEEAGAALVFEMELPEPVTDAAAQGQLAALLEGGVVPDTPLVRLFRILARHGALELLEFAFPGDAERRAAIHALREAAPTRVNELLAERARAAQGVRKVGGDVIVPFERVAEMVQAYEGAFARRGLEHAAWGHLSDGNLHPNAIPRDEREVEVGYEALLELATAVTSLGGCPLSEHGVGRNPVKQEMLRRFLGDEALVGLRRVKQALDPEGRFAPGVLFPAADPAFR